MQNKIIFFFIAGSILLLTSCHKDVDIFTPTGNPVGLDTNWLSIVTSGSPISELKHALVKDNFIDSLDCTIGGTIQTQQSMTITVTPASLLFPNGSLASGKIFIESILIRQKGDMIRVDRPTTSHDRLLISGGEVFIRIRKENEELHLAPGKRIYMRYSDPAPSTAMRLFFGDESNFERFNWIPNQDSLSSLGFGTPNSPAYEFATPNLRWINCDHFSDSSGPRVTVVASLPIDYTNANTAVYLVFHDTNSLMGMYGNASTKKFASGKISVGKQAIVVSITKKGTNSFYLAHENIVTSLSGTVATQVVPLSPHPTSIADIKSYLATL